MELLESIGVRPRQARYQAALRPDMKCTLDSKALSDFAPIQTTSKTLDRARNVHNRGYCNITVHNGATVVEHISDRFVQLCVKNLAHRYERVAA